MTCRRKKASLNRRFPIGSPCDTLLLRVDEKILARH